MTQMRPRDPNKLAKAITDIATHYPALRSWGRRPLQLERPPPII